MGPLGKDAARVCHSARGHNAVDVEGEEEVLSSWLWFGAFSWESRVGPRHWRKAFLFISSLIWAFANCATLLFFVLLLSIQGLIFVSVWLFFFFWNQSPCQEKMNHKENALSGIQFCSSMCIYFCRNTESLT